MISDEKVARPWQPNSGGGHNVDDLSDTLDELRILLPSAQLLAAFLITLPFIPGFSKIVHFEKWVFIGTFLCSVASLVLLSAPAMQHRLMRSLKDRVAFKRFASLEILAGGAMLSLALILGTNLVISEVFGASAGIVVAASMALLTGVLWWLLPVVLKNRRTSGG